MLSLIILIDFVVGFGNPNFSNLAELRKCARSKNIKILTESDIRSCQRKNIQDRFLLSRRKRQEGAIEACIPCQKEEVLVPKKVKIQFQLPEAKTNSKFQVLEQHLGNWVIHTINGKHASHNDLIDIGECIGHCDRHIHRSVFLYTPVSQS